MKFKYGGAADVNTMAHIGNAMLIVRDFTGIKRISRFSQTNCRFHGIGPKTADFTGP